jgi:hypothetical protein
VISSVPYLIFIVPFLSDKLVCLPVSAGALLSLFLSLSPVLLPSASNLAA